MHSTTCPSSFSGCVATPVANTSHSIGGDKESTGDGPGTFDVRGNVWHLECCNPQDNIDGNGWLIFGALTGWTNNATSKLFSTSSAPTYFAQLALCYPMSSTGWPPSSRWWSSSGARVACEYLGLRAPPVKQGVSDRRPIMAPLMKMCLHWSAALLRRYPSFQNDLSCHETKICLQSSVITSSVLTAFEIMDKMRKGAPYRYVVDNVASE